MTFVAMAKTTSSGVTTSKMSQGDKSKSSPTTTSTAKSTTTTTTTIDKSKIKQSNDNKVKDKKVKQHHNPPPKHPKKKPSIVKGSADYQRRYIMGWNLSCSDDMKETKLKASFPHTKAFLDGYHDSRTGDGPCPF